MKVDELTVNSLPSSFVFRRLKLESDNGAGEAKLFIGSVHNSEKFDNFFENYSNSNEYLFIRENILLYLEQVKIEYVYQAINKYKDINYSYWQDEYNQIKEMQDDDFNFVLTKFVDKARYYIRSDESIFKNFFRKVALPKISQLVIEKYKDGNNFKYIFNIKLNLKLENNIDKSSEQDIEVITYPYNRIIFGAPGTGKSHRINEDRGIFQDRYERVTFHPNYSYGQFVGTYKPVPSKDKDGKDSITYTYVPGPFMRTYVKAINDNKPYLLIIEEINRANVAAVFGDVFQLLDRKNGESEYSIETSEDIRKYLALKLFHKEYDDCLDDQKEQCNNMKIPSNMYIWATMNSADQGVYPMDTAFKRRWSFEYIGINDEQKDMDMVNVLLPSNENKQQQVNWNSLRKAINSKLLDNSIQKINEDKLLGPYFLSNEIIKKKPNDLEHMVVDNDRFLKEFKSKVLMYLYEDVCKQHKNIIFNDKGHNIKAYSSICETFDNEGLAVFTDDIAKRVKVKEITKLEAKETESEEQQTESPENR